MQYTAHIDSPVGGILLASDGQALTGLWFDKQKYFADTLETQHKEMPLPVFTETGKWLALYFKGRDPGFWPPLSFSSTPFREEVWKILLTIPYGQTRTYGEIAEEIAKEKGIPRMSAQAVGGAVGHNPISILIPCHRVIGSGGNLTGYAGGLAVKRKLLVLEGIM